MAEYPANQPSGQSRQEGDYSHPPAADFMPRPPLPPHGAGKRPARGGKPGKRTLIIAAIAVVVLALAASAFMLLSGKKEGTAKVPAATTATTEEDRQDAGSQQPSSNGPQTYKSTKLNIAFTYPAGWKMKENADKTVITLTSPQVSYTKKDGSSASGVFTLRLRNDVVSDGLRQAVESAVAMKDSEIIAYDQPTDQQRQYTNITFGGNGPNTTFFIVSGGVAFKAGEAFGSNIDLQGAVYLFAGGYGADTGDTLAFDSVPKATFESATYQQALGIIKSLKIY